MKKLYILSQNVTGSVFRWRRRLSTSSFKKGFVVPTPFLLSPLGTFHALACSALVLSLTPDGRESLAELRRAGMIGQDVLGNFWLKDEAIIYMENRFKNGLSEVLEYVGKMVSPISGLFS